ncbi:MAG: DNA-methyltransferase [Kiritimatiellia bacterium]|jgi:site-specific DNA-methyltransferase (adenine-specific)
MPKKRRSEQLTLEMPHDVGTIYPVDEQQDTPQLHFEMANGKLYLGDSMKWLRSLESATVDMVFADPPYNIGKADWDVFQHHDQYIDWCFEWISECARILKPTGTLYVCGFSEFLADIKARCRPLFESCRWLVWHYKNKANLRDDWGRSHESIVHFRKSSAFTFNTDAVRVPYGAHTLKYPVRSQAETSQYGKGKKRHERWCPHPQGAKPKDVIEIPTTCNGMGEKTPHPTQKPEELVRKFVLASSRPDELVCDPFSGSGTTLVVAQQLGRKWIGCDKSEEYNGWCIKRLKHAVTRSEAEWIAYDARNAARRESIR